MKKKLLFIIAVLTISGLVRAQSEKDCLPFFPDRVGAVMVSKNYDASNNLLHTITYRVIDASDRFYEDDASIGFIITDKDGVAIDQGGIAVRCENGNFYLKMVNRAMSPDIMNILGEDTNLVGEFLDYPNTFSDVTPLGGSFKMTGGEYAIQSKNGNKDDDMRVRIYNREYEKNEEVTTPAGTFESSKITFSFDVYRDGKTVTYKGVEWYALRAGIVRSETYKEDQLQNYTVLTVLKR